MRAAALRFASVCLKNILPKLSFAQANRLFSFLVAVLPGFIFLVLRGQHRPSRKLSPLRETATVLLVSVLSYAPVVIAMVVLAFLCPSFNAGLGAAFSDPEQYQELHLYRLAGTVVAAVLLGSGIAALSG